MVGNTKSCSYGPICTYGFVLKMSETGKFVWSHIIGEDDSSSTNMHHLAECQDGSIVTIGTTGASKIGIQDAVITKFTSAGKMIWQRVYGTPGRGGHHAPQRIYANSNGTLTALTWIYKPYSNRYTSIHAIEINGSNGSISGHTHIRTGSNRLANALKIPDGYVVLDSMFYSKTGKYTSSVQKINTNGTIQWSRAYYAKKNDDSLLALGINNSFTISKCQDGYIISATGEDKELYQFKINTSGDVAWMKKHKVYPSSVHDITSDAALTPDGYCLISITNGFTAVDNVIIKTRLSNGSRIWVNGYSKGVMTTPPFFRAICPADGGFAAAGEQWMTLMSAVFNDNGELNKSCRYMNIIPRQANSVNADFWETGGGGAGGNDLLNPIESRTANLIYRSNCFSRQNFCGSINGSTMTPIYYLLLGTW